MQFNRITSRSQAILEKQTNKVYLEHVEAIFIVDVAPKEYFLKFGDLWEEDDKQLAQPR